MLAAPLVAVSVASSEPAPADRKPNAIETIAGDLDRIHSVWSSGIVRTVERFDRMFGDERLHEEADGTRVTLQGGVRVDERDGARMEKRIRAHVALPNIEKRLLLFFDDRIENEHPADLEALSEAVRDSEPVTGLRWVLAQYGKARVNADAGLRFGSKTQVLGRLRASIVKSFDDWERRLTQTVSWYSADGFATSTEARWTRDLGHERLFRSSSALGWREDESGVTPSQSFYILHAVTKRRGHRYGVRAEWPQCPHTREARYTAEYVFRRRIHRDWLYFEAGPGIVFDQEYDYAPNPFGVVRLECIFSE